MLPGNLDIHRWIVVLNLHVRCGPCHAIAPVYETLARKHNNVNFLKCDVDVAKDVASRYAISAM